jgi:hypothetical protein
MDLKITAIPVPPNSFHPDPPDLRLPKHEFVWTLTAPPGKGKTTTMLNLLKFYKYYFHRIIIASPSIRSDEKFKWLKKQNLLAENKKLKNWLKSKIKNTKDDGIVSNDNTQNKFQEILDALPSYDPKIPDEDYLEVTYDIDSVEKKVFDLMDENRMIIDFLEEYGESKYMANRVLFIIDDLVQSKLFKRTEQFVSRITRHRHYGSSFLFGVQAYKEIPKTIRTCSTCLTLYRIGNQKELDVIYEEHPMDLKHDHWMEIYNYTIHGSKHNFLFINYNQDDDKRLMKNFDEFISYVPDDESPRKKQKIE